MGDSFVPNDTLETKGHHHYQIPLVIVYCHGLKQIDHLLGSFIIQCSASSCIIRLSRCLIQPIVKCLN